MIHAVLIFNTLGKPRLIKFYDGLYPPDVQKEIIDHTFQLVHSRKVSQCNFVETNIFKTINQSPELLLMYRQYATLYVVFCVDKSENELAILDLIQIFVEALDRCFETVCELDVIFNTSKIHYILNEMIIGGLVVETDLEEIMKRYYAQKRLDTKSEEENKAQIAAARVRNQLDLEGKVKKLHKNVKFKLLPNL